MASNSDKELQDALDQDLGEFEWERSRIGGVWGPEPSFPDLERKVVKSSPPVTIHVGKIPSSLHRSGLENIFSKFGEILKMDLIRGKGSGGFNFAFITFCSRLAAAEAVAVVNRAPPLHLVVRFKIDDKQKAERLEQERRAEEFNLKWNNNICPGGDTEELDYDEEIRREKRMDEDVDKFFDNPDSDVELNMLHSKTSIKTDKEEVVKVMCKRCGKEAQARCSICKEEKYCGAACQCLDWPDHRKLCCGKKTSEAEDHGEDDVPLDGTDADAAEEKEPESNCNTISVKEELALKKEMEDGGSVLECPPVETEDTSSDHEEFLSLADCVCSNTKVGSEEETAVTSTVNPWETQHDVQLPSLEKANPDVPTPTKPSLNVEEKDADVVSANVSMEKDLPKIALHDGCLVWLKDISKGGKWGVIKTVEGVGEPGERDMLEDVMEVCSELDNLVEAPVAGQLVGVLHEKKWVRAVVEKVEDEGCVWLHGVDHLCYLKIKQLSCLKQLPDVSLIVSSQCITVRLVKNKLDSTMVDEVFAVKLMGETKEFPKVELLTNNNNEVNSKCENNNNVEDIKRKTEIGIEMLRLGGVEKNSSKTGNVTLRVRKMMDLTVLHVESPTAVYMCPVLPELKDFQKHLFKTASELSFDSDFVPQVGSIVLARTKSDGYWYRVRVISCSERRVTFFCPDFGFIDRTRLDSVRKINSRLAETFNNRKFLACRCVLVEWRDGTKPPTDTETVAIKKIVKISDKTMKVMVVEKRDGCYVVDIPGVDRVKLNRIGEMEEEVARIRRDIGSVIGGGGVKK